MTTDILVKIDRATGCQWCYGPLGDSPSNDFCSDLCQHHWYASRAVRLVGYREPWYEWGFNGNREFRPNSAPAAPFDVRTYMDAIGRLWRVEVRPEYPRVEFREYREPAIISQAAPTYDVRERALELRRNRNTGPALPWLDGRRRP